MVEILSIISLFIYLFLTRRCVCNRWFTTVREENRLTMFDSSVKWKMFRRNLGATDRIVKESS